VEHRCRALAREEARELLNHRREGVVLGKAPVGGEVVHDLGEAGGELLADVVDAHAGLIGDSLQLVRPDGALELVGIEGRVGTGADPRVGLVGEVRALELLEQVAEPPARLDHSEHGAQHRPAEDLGEHAATRAVEEHPKERSE
jgi:hypothetical protein